MDNRINYKYKYKKYKSKYLELRGGGLYMLSIKTKPDIKNLHITENLEYVKYYTISNIYIHDINKVQNIPCLKIDHVLKYGSIDGVTYKPTEKTAEYISDIVKILYYTDKQDRVTYEYQDYIKDIDAKYIKTTLTDIKII